VIEREPQRLDVARFSPANRRPMTGQERRLVLGLPFRPTYHDWAKTAREHGEVTLDILLRLFAALGIHQALRILHTTEREGLDWLRRPHGATVFGAGPPLALMTCGTPDGLLTVRRFLDAARAGLYMAPNAADADLARYTDADIVFS
jgi:hypothetical protein